MKEKTQYKIKLILLRLRLLKLAKYFYYKSTNWKNNWKNDRKISKLKKIQGVEIKNFGHLGEVSLDDCKLILDRKEFHDFVMLKTLESGRKYEPEVTAYVYSKLKPGDIFMDIGANNGYYSIIASQLVGPFGKVISIEPNPNAYSRLLRNIESNKLQNVYPFSLALSDHNGTANLFLNNGSEDGLASLKGNAENTAITEVKVRKFDDLFGNEEIKLIKMDVEGSEIDIIKSMENYLNTHNTVSIIMEWSRTYTTKDDYDYLKGIFLISILTFESGNINRVRINNYGQLESCPYVSNLLLER